MNEPRYVSPFQATLNAIELQWEVGSDLLSHSPCVVPEFIGIPSRAHQLSSHRPLPRQVVQKQVRFADQIDVLLGEEDEFPMYGTQVSQQTIYNWPSKPWSKKRTRKQTPEMKNYPEINDSYSHEVVSPEPLSNLAVLSRDSTRHEVLFGPPVEILTPEREDDIFHAMQQPDSSHSLFDHSDHSDSPANIPQDWMLDLQRIVARHAEECTADRDAEFLFSIYTWFLDHEDSTLCNTPKIAILGGDPTEWEEDLIYPWRHRLRRGERTQLRLVQPNTQRAAVEEHIAHIIVIQRETDDSSVLLAMEFPSEHEHNVIVRTAAVVPRSCTALDISTRVPIFDRFFPNRMTWEHPISNPEDDRHLSFATWPGLCIRVGVTHVTHPDFASDQEAVRENQFSLLQKSSDVLLPRRSTQAHIMPEKPCDSFTEEFLQAVQAVQQAQEIEPPPIDPLSIEAQPRAFQELWARFHLQTALNSTNMPETARIESWYLNHVTYHKCHSSRLTLLSTDFLRWREQIVNTWSDKVNNLNALTFDLVEPMPEDSATGIIAQLVLTEADMPLKKSAVLSVYDSEEDNERNPYTFALVLQSRISLSRLLDTLHLQLDCPPVNIRNLCSLWFGSIPIGNSHEVSVQAGNAYRLVLSRGVFLDVPHLLTLDNTQLRSFATGNSLRNL